MKCPVKPGVRGWLLTGAVILAVDLLDESTLSETFLEFSKTPIGRVVTVTAWAFLTIHLFGVIPVERDPLYIFFKHTPNRNRKRIVVL